MTDESSVRTCAGCGESEGPEAFERFIWTEETGLFHDLRKKAPGRGANVHADPECLARAARSGFRRSFKAQVDAPEPDEFVEQVGDAIRTRLDEALRLAARSGAAGIGAKGVDEKMKANAADVVFIAQDAGEATAKKYLANAERKSLAIVSAFNGATIGKWSGRDFVAVMTVEGRLAQSALRDVESLVRLDRIGG